MGMVQLRYWGRTVSTGWKAAGLRAEVVRSSLINWQALNRQHTVRTRRLNSDDARPVAPAARERAPQAGYRSGPWPGDRRGKHKGLAIWESGLRESWEARTKA